MSYKRGAVGLVEAFLWVTSMGLVSNSEPLGSTIMAGTDYSRFRSNILVLDEGAWYLSWNSHLAVLGHGQTSGTPLLLRARRVGLKGTGLWMKNQVSWLMLLESRGTWDSHPVA